MTVRHRPHGATKIYCSAACAGIFAVGVLAVPAILVLLGVVAVMAVVFALWGV
jgi:hypothetical protein